MVSSHSIVPDPGPWYDQSMNYLYLEIPLPLPVEPEQEEEDECEFLVKDYLEDAIKYVNG